MTRINIVPVEMLTNEHLRGEYKEITRVFTLSRKHFERTGELRPKDAPASYVLGEGHVKFFYDKLNWVLQRYMKLHAVMKQRGFNPDRALYQEVSFSAAEFAGFHHDRSTWPEFSPEEYYLSMARIAGRSQLPAVLSELGKNN